MTTKMDEIKQRYASGYKGLEAERAFPDVAYLLTQHERLRDALVEIQSYGEYDLDDRDAYKMVAIAEKALELNGC